MLPSPTIPAPGEPYREDDERDSSVFVAPPCDAALLIRNPELRTTTAEVLRDAGYRAVEGLRPARVILFEAEPGIDLLLALSSVRAAARSDAAILLIVDPTTRLTPDMGVFACVCKPLMAESLLAVVASALEAQSVRLKIADLSRRLDLEAHLASIGRMSAGLTHELGSPLMVASTTFEFVRDGVRKLPGVDRSEQGKLLEALDDANASLQRMQALLATMQEIVRRPKCSLGPVHLAQVAAEVRRWAGAEGAFSGTQFDLVVDNQEVLVLAERVRLTQILVNLVSNAVQAARKLPSPRVRIHVYRAAAGGVISVRDNGPGIARDAQAQIFEPFYTTRRDAGGTGLGLSLCREYALQMSAQLSLWSAPGRGACFRLVFQAA
jgi:signal transduction histidine kinase